MATLDHLVVTSPTLAQGVTYVEDLLGITLHAGGHHALFGTHNRLLSLAGGVYLEVIAVDPDAPPPGRRRWFNLDQAPAAPALTHWVCDSADLPRDMARVFGAHAEAAPLDLARGTLTWQMGLPKQTDLPFQGLCPALISWQGEKAGQLLPASGCTLNAVTLIHPEADALADRLAPVLQDERVTLETGEKPRITARITTPKGEVILS
ncbi:MAG: VOC family protein [Thalassovita sp.]